MEILNKISFRPEAESILQSIDEIVIVVDEIGRMKFANKNAAEFLEKDKDFLINKQIYDTLYTKKIGPRLSRSIITSIQKDKIDSRRKVKENQISYEIKTKHYHNKDNNETYTILILKNITEVENLRNTKKDFTIITFTIVATLCLMMLFWQASESLYVNMPSWVISRFMEIIGIVVVFVTLGWTRLTFYDLGLFCTFPEFRRTMKKASILSLILIVGFVFFRLLFGSDIGIEPGTAFFDFHFEDPSQVTYFFVAPLQEFVSKGAIQGSISKVLDRKSPFLAIFIASLIFMILHTAYGIFFMIISFVMSFILGWIYEKDKNIWGCSLIHFTVGFFPVCFGLI